MAVSPALTAHFLYILQKSDRPKLGKSEKRLNWVDVPYLGVIVFKQSSICLTKDI